MRKIDRKKGNCGGCTALRYEHLLLVTKVIVDKCDPILEILDVIKRK